MIPYLTRMIDDSGAGDGLDLTSSVHAAAALASAAPAEGSSAGLQLSGAALSALAGPAFGSSHGGGSSLPPNPLDNLLGVNLKEWMNEDDEEDDAAAAAGGAITEQAAEAAVGEDDAAAAAKDGAESMDEGDEQAERKTQEPFSTAVPATPPPASSRRAAAPAGASGASAAGAAGSSASAAVAPASASAAAPPSSAKPALSQSARRKRAAAEALLDDSAEMREILGAPPPPQPPSTGKRGGLQQVLKRHKRPGVLSKLPPDLERRMGEANSAYIGNDFARAVDILLHIIQAAPHALGPYQLLGLIYEERGDMPRAIEAFMLAAHMSKRDWGLWKRVGRMARDNGQLEHAVYCYTKVLQSETDNHALRLERALTYFDLKEWRKALDGFLYLLKLKRGGGSAGGGPEGFEHDPALLRHAASCYAQMHKPQAGLVLLRRYLDWFKDTVASNRARDAEDPNQRELHRDKRRRFEAGELALRQPSSSAGAESQEQGLHMDDMSSLLGAPLSAGVVDPSLLRGADLDVNLVNILCELYLTLHRPQDVVDAFDELAHMLRAAVRRQNRALGALPPEIGGFEGGGGGDEGESDAEEDLAMLSQVELPFDLLSKQGIALIQLGDMEAADAVLAPLIDPLMHQQRQQQQQQQQQSSDAAANRSRRNNQPDSAPSASPPPPILYDVDNWGDLYHEVADAYVHHGGYAQAEALCDALVQSAQWRVPAVFLTQARVAHFQAREQLMARSAAATEAFSSGISGGGSASNAFANIPVAIQARLRKAKALYEQVHEANVAAAEAKAEEEEMAAAAAAASTAAGQQGEGAAAAAASAAAAAESNRVSDSMDVDVRLSLSEVYSTLGEHSKARDILAGLSEEDYDVAAAFGGLEGVQAAAEAYDATVEGGAGSSAAGRRRGSGRGGAAGGGSKSAARSEAALNRLRAKPQSAVALRHREELRLFSSSCELLLAQGDTAGFLQLAVPVLVAVISAAVLDNEDEDEFLPHQLSVPRVLVPAPTTTAMETADTAPATEEDGSSSAAPSTASAAAAVSSCPDAAVSMVLATPRFLNLPLDRSHSLNAQRLVLSFEFLRPAFAAVKALYAAERLPEALWIIVQLERVLVRFTHSATANAAASARRFAAEAAARGESDAAAQHTSGSGSGNGPLLSEHVHRLLQALKYIAGCIFLRLGDPERAYRSLRPALMAHPRSFALAYVLNIVLRAQHYPNKAFKMLERLQRHRPDALPLRMILGHFYLVHQNWEQALSHYTRVWAALPRTPLLPLLIGVARLQQALKKTNQQRHHDLLLAFACLGHYRQLKEEQAQARATSLDLFRPGQANSAAAATSAAAAARQEACYNVARAFHTVGLGYLARPLYEQVLASSSEAGGGGRTTGTTGLGSLHAEAAHNLASIYEHAGSPELARKLYAQYCRI